MRVKLTAKLTEIVLKSYCADLVYEVDISPLLEAIEEVAKIANININYTVDSFEWILKKAFEPSDLWYYRQQTYQLEYVLKEYPIKAKEREITIEIDTSNIIEF